MSSDEPHCIDGPDGCAASCSNAGRDTGSAWPRCERHDRERRQRERRADPESILAPHDFDPEYSGERWEHD